MTPFFLSQLHQLHPFREQRKTRIEAPIGDFFNRSTNVGRDSSTRGGESESDEDYIPLGKIVVEIPRIAENTLQCFFRSECEISFLL